MPFSNNIKGICGGIEKFPDKGILEYFITDFTGRTDGLFGVLLMNSWNVSILFCVLLVTCPTQHFESAFNWLYAT